MNGEILEEWLGESSGIIKAEFVWGGISGITYSDATSRDDSDDALLMIERCNHAIYDVSTQDMQSESI